MNRMMKLMHLKLSKKKLLIFLKILRDEIKFGKNYKNEKHI